MERALTDLVPEDITVAYLHMNIQKAMGWENKHLYAFIVEDVLIESDLIQVKHQTACQPLQKFPSWLMWTIRFNTFMIWETSGGTK